MAEIEALLQHRIATREPYCGMFDECLQQDFLPEKCRPKSCPYQEQVACRYVNAQVQVVRRKRVVGGFNYNL